jgi:hypothetical protein
MSSKKMLNDSEDDQLDDSMDDPARGINQVNSTSGHGAGFTGPPAPPGRQAGFGGAPAPPGRQRKSELTQD